MGTQVCQNGNGNGKSARDSGNGNSYFFMCAKIPIGGLDANHTDRQLCHPNPKIYTTPLRGWSTMHVYY